MTRIHLRSKLELDIAERGDIAYVVSFTVIAVFIMLIACINFTNLATARSANRAKEVGMRKVLGAQRGELIRQFVGESLFVQFYLLYIGSDARGTVLAAISFFVRQ